MTAKSQIKSEAARRTELRSASQRSPKRKNSVTVDHAMARRPINAPALAGFFAPIWKFLSAFA
jgi:hypothetical protein